jgi:hypothetical protein
MADTHTHDWIDLGNGTSTCAVNGCQAMHHEHRYSQNTQGQWRCSCGSWTPTPPPPPAQIEGLSRSNQCQPNLRAARKPRPVRKPVGCRR